MRRYDALHRIEQTGVIAILRSPGGDVVEIARALHAGGVQAIEVTADTPGAVEAIGRLRAELPSALIGAGTVLDPETARTVILAGAQFLVTPTLSPETIEMATRYDKLIIPGAFTPTEILRAYECGALAVKVFPAADLGPEYIKHVSGPLAQVPLIPTGGVHLANAAAFIEAGAAAVGLGGSLVPRADVEAGAYDAVRERAQAVIEAVREARQRRAG